MQYVLTEEEYRALVPEDRYISRELALAYLRKRLLEADGFTCIHDHERRTGYCDDCPCSPLSVPKGERQPRDFSRDVCDLTHHYSK